MQSDDVIWSVINTQFCSYKVKTTTQNFCRNEYNVTGFCTRQSCPLANSRYATVREHEGVLYLYIKTIERAHSPKNMWEKIRLANNYSTALEQIDKELIHWPSFLIHKCKQRVTKITQYLIKMRRLRLRQEPKLVGVKKKLERREATRERKALSAAKLERSIAAELLERLKSKAYGDAPLNVNEEVWRQVLDREKADKEGVKLEDEESEEENEEEEMEEEEEGWGDREFVSDISGDEDGLSDVEDAFSEDDGSDEEEGSGEDKDEPSEEEDSPKGKGKVTLGKRKAPTRPSKPPKKRPEKKARRGPRVEVEYEHEMETTPLTKEALANW
ncbi:uncharacterized protein PHACADRAFT_152270 [Phanerochaete carnosa HHB-10118-sp]|uniref:Protein MAK16 n=1 Tax=Phanerochaete carnosa (strain HHB-10118-sp) TaxID=650164 RepID=K5WJF8_PHACS|nr:uncharacterized protein PHACADRAFT_152270 [Phanerochaete carnosa HHB-10118-sp]EKM50362.1 hypothetical protein PHACADRAFT_152270 [Phanerochaete carnosa HHB-10118-sp]